MSKEFIVAIELGSSKIIGVAGRKNIDGSITVLKVVKEPTHGCIRKGVVYNIDKTEALLKEVVNKLSTSLGYEIKCVYVGAGGQSIRSVRNVINKTFDTETVITDEMVDELMDSNRNMQYPDHTIIGQATQEYKVDQQYQLDPVGIQCTKLEGNFLNILWRKTFDRKFNKCFQDTGIAIAELYLSPLVLAESVLTESERRNGCMLVDIGADTTTVATYYRNLLRHLAVIPLGSNNINKDLTNLQIDEAEAEELKLKYASAYNEEQEPSNTLLSIDGERSISAKDFTSLVECRMEEIIRNAWFQVPQEYTDKLLGGIIITGGGSNIENIDKAFQYHTKKNKVRIAHTVNQTIDSNHPDIKAQDGTMNTILVGDAAAKLLKLDEMQDAMAGLTFQGTGKMITPMGATMLRSSAVPSNTIIGLDKHYALEMVKGSDVLVEYDKLIVTAPLQYFGKYADIRPDEKEHFDKIDYERYDTMAFLTKPEDAPEISYYIMENMTPERLGHLMVYYHRWPDLGADQMYVTYALRKHRDLKEIDWAVIWMVAGGFALGLAMNGTGLAENAVKSIPFDTFNPIVIMIVSGLVCFALSNFISNTATAALLIPILTVVCAGMGSSLESIGGTSTIIIGVAVAASCAMSLPISTPPNAIAYSTGLIQQTDMVKAGLTIGLISMILGYGVLITFCKMGVL